MVNTDTDVIFPPRVIPALASSSGDLWQALVERVLAAGADSHAEIAMVLLMARLCGCAGCNADSFRAMRGCTQCARLSAKRFKGSADELDDTFAQALREVQTYLDKK